MVICSLSIVPEKITILWLFYSILTVEKAFYFFPVQDRLSLKQTNKNKNSFKGKTRLLTIL